MRAGWIVAALLALGAGCDSADETTGTHVYVYNQTRGVLRLDSLAIEPTYSLAVHITHGATDTYQLVDRSSTEYRLIVTSLVPAGDPDHLEAAINIHENQAETLYVVEYSPHLDAALMAP